MSDTMPERVWLTPDPYAMSGDWWADGKTVREDGEVPYVPEQRALEAEREMSNMAYEYNILSSQSAQELADLRAERDALQSDLKALLPLVRVLLNYHDNRAKGEYARLDGADESFFAAARAILDREGI